MKILITGAPEFSGIRLFGHASKALLLSCCFGTMGFGADIRSVEIEHDGTRYQLVSKTHFDAPQEDVYSALIDYDHLSAVSKKIKESYYLDATEDGLPLVYTRVAACVLFYCRTIEKVERLEVDMPRYIATTAIPERSTVRYSRSEWSLEAEEGGGTQVIYRLEFEPDFWVPPIIGPMVIKRMLLADGASAVQEIEAMSRRHAAARGITSQ